MTRVCGCCLAMAVASKQGMNLLTKACIVARRRFGCHATFLEHPGANGVIRILRSGKLRFEVMPDKRPRALPVRASRSTSAPPKVGALLRI